ncbi:MAG: PilZ domain-containing protein [Acidobacteriota bacterium]|nr:PilZ domain-containing protein [Acidobacteriota bacterium]
MSIEQRRFIRFSLDIPAIREGENGEKHPITLHQISIGGCLAGADERIFTGAEFRVLLRLPSGNFLPLTCKAIYKFAGTGIGAKFLNITEFEQQLLADVISQTLEAEGLPLQVDPFAHPPSLIYQQQQQQQQKPAEEEKLPNPRLEKEEIVERILSSDN